jgi:hypothetical protein
MERGFFQLTTVISRYLTLAISFKDKLPNLVQKVRGASKDYRKHSSGWHSEPAENQKRAIMDL